jgi:23S rRNA (guanosine2251-2'-O)-methyltransferase
VTNLARLLAQLKDQGVWIVGTSDRAEQTLYDLDLTGSLAIIVGAEGKGLRRLTAERCDFLAYLPMAGLVNSLNVSVAAGVCLYEAVRQRGP